MTAKKKYEARKLTLTLSPKAWEEVEAAARTNGVSCSRLIELVLLYGPLEREPSSDHLWKDMLVSAHEEESA